MKYGAIEAGGTKFVCAVSDEQHRVLARAQFPTENPAKTMPQVIAFFKANPVDAIGVGSFGPLGVNPAQADYGYITETPKAGWAHYDFLGALKAEFTVPMAWTTDVNMAGYGEMKAGAAQGQQNVVYFTVGTGVGAGIINQGQILTGATHPEVGHIGLKRLPNDDFVGNCPYHHDCLEGLTAGPAIQKRIGAKAATLPENSPVWDYEAEYLAQACVNVTMIVAPDIIVFGGGVMKQLHLFPKIRAAFTRLNAGYQPTPAVDRYIVPVGLGDDAGIMGGFLLAEKALKEA